MKRVSCDHTNASCKHAKPEKSKNKAGKCKSNTISSDEANRIYQKLLKQFESHNLSKNVKKPWTEDESKLLFWSVKKYCNEKLLDSSNLSTKDWEKIALLVPGRNITQCHYKWSSNQTHIANKVPWSVEEDTKLTEIINSKGVSSWSIIARELNSQLQCKRTGKQCRERWLNHLSPTISKDPWKTEEDIRLLEAQKKFGNKWSEISKLLSGRTENSVKNRFNCLLKKEKEEMIGKNINGKNVDDALSNAIKVNEDDGQWVESILNKKRMEAMSQNSTLSYQPLQDSIKNEIHTFLGAGEINSTSTAFEQGLRQCEPSNTCPNFRFLMRRNTLLKDSEKFINPSTKQALYVHPIGIYFESNNRYFKYTNFNQILRAKELTIQQMIAAQPKPSMSNLNPNSAFKLVGNADSNTALPKQENYSPQYNPFFLSDSYNNGDSPSCMLNKMNGNSSPQYFPQSNI